MNKRQLLCLALLAAGSARAQTYVSQAGNALSLSASAPAWMESAAGIATLQPASALTIEAWVRPTCCQNNDNTIAAFGNGNGDAWSLVTGAAGPELMLRNGTTTKEIKRSVKPDALDLNRDYHLAVTWSAATNVAAIYIDGFCYYSDSAVGFAAIGYGTGSKLAVGAGTALNAPFNGRIDELRIWNTARTQAAVRAGLNQQLSGSEAGLIGYYRFNEAAGAPASADLSPSGATLTAFNFSAANRVASSAEIPSKLSYNTQLIQQAAWTDVRTVAPGITAKYKLFDTLFNNKVSVSILDIDLATADIDLRIANLPANSSAALAKMKTSEFMRKYGAIAAINGSYYNTGSPYGSAAFVRENGVSTVATNQQHGVGYPDEKAIVFNTATSTAPQLIDRPQPNAPAPNYLNGWTGFNAFDNAMSSGPGLLTAGNVSYEYVPMDISHEGPNGRGAWSWHMSAYPFTALGLTANNHLILAVGDGKFASSGGPAGINCPNLAHFMKALGCTDAMKLDGGGSSTMTIEGATFNDVVNYPSDNGVFDHNGERANTNALLLVPRARRGSGSALSFDGAGNKVVIADSLIGNPAGAFTVEGWAKIGSGATNTDELINKNENSTARKGYYLEYNNSNGRLIAGIARATNAWATVSTAGAAWTANQWHHVAMSYSDAADSLRLYVDGQLIGAAYAPDPVFSNRPLCLGGSDAYPANGLKGALDEVRFWNRELSAAEIRQGMHRNADTAAADLAAYYKMDEFYIGTVRDHSGHQRHGTATGGMNLHSIIASYAPIAGAKFDSLDGLAANWWTSNTGGDTTLSWHSPIAAEDRYLLHAATAASGDTSAGLPYGISRRLRKLWLLDKFGIASNAMNLSFNGAGLGAGVLDSSREYYLLYSADGTNFQPANPVPVTPADTSLSFPNVEVQEGWYTLGWQPRQHSTVPGNQAFRFDGGTNIVRVPGFGNPSGDFSIEFWARPDAGGSGDDAMINANENSSGRKGYFVEYGYANSGTPGLKAGIAQTSGTWALAHHAGAAWQPGQWHHVAMTYDATLKTIRLYEDGAEVATAGLGQETALFSNRPFAIGGSDYYSSNGFRGAMDEVRVWDRLLSAAEIAENMHLNVPPGAAGLKACFGLDSLGSSNGVFNAVSGGQQGAAAASLTAGSVITSYAPIEPQPTAGFVSWKANWWPRNAAHNSGLSVQSGYSNEPVFLLHANNAAQGLVTTGLPAGTDGRLGRVWKVRKQGLGVSEPQLLFLNDSLGLPLDSLSAVYLLQSADNSSFAVVDSLTAAAIGDTLQFAVADTLDAYLTLGFRRKVYPPAPQPTALPLLEEQALAVYPNPVGGSLNIRFYHDLAANASLALFDAGGGLVQGQSLPVSAGGNHFVLTVAQLSQGQYTLQLTIGDRVLTRSILKL